MAASFFLKIQILNSRILRQNRVTYINDLPTGIIRPKLFKCLDMLLTTIDDHINQDIPAFLDLPGKVMIIKD